MPIEVGTEAPDFELRDQNNQRVRLSDFRGKRTVLLVFYPLAMGFALVYFGEHYVADVILGWIYVVVVVLLARTYERHRNPERSPSHESDDRVQVVGVRALPRR